MALSANDEHMLSELIALAEAQIAWKQQAEVWCARYNLNDLYNKLAPNNNPDLSPQLSHLSQGEVGNGFNAFEAVIATLGSGGAGSHLAALYLLKS